MHTYSSVHIIRRHVVVVQNSILTVFYFYFILKYTSITPPANSKANQGRWCVDGLSFLQ